MTAFSIPPVLAHYGVVVHQRSGWQKIRCPVHSDQIPSASVSTEFNYIVCYACGFRGTALDLIAMKEGCSLEAAATIAEGLTGESGSRVRGGSGWRSQPGSRVSQGSGYRPRYRSGSPTRVRRH